MTESHQLSKALIAAGYKLVSPVYSVQYPLLGDGCPFAHKCEEDIRALIFSYVGVKFRLTLPYTDDISQALLDLEQFKHVERVIQTIVDFLPSDCNEEQLYLAHV